jgi:predicted AlkP superfamily pyrophosphatase or phosphodiesterase
MKLRSVLFIFLLSFILLGCENTNENTNETYNNYVILVSFDGFRWDYPDLYKTPNFDQLAEDGVKADRLIPSFPTKTFPNHYSLATGLYPDHHGIINNSFQAPDLDLFYRIGSREMVQNPDFYGGEPIWVTAENQGVKSASFFWVGSEAPIKGVLPSIWKQYNEVLSFDARIDTVVSWLKLPLVKRPRFVLLYFHEPDAVGHSFGPENQATGKVIENLDRILGDLRDELSKLPYGDKINLIVTSDHGMGAISPDRYVNILDHVDQAWIKDFYGSNPVYLIDTRDGYADTTAKVLDAEEGISAWKKEDVPKYLNYGTNDRIPEVVVVADSSWSIGVKKEAADYNGGVHGYDNTNSDMHAIFYADGPAFKDNFKHSSFENVDIYLLIAQLLELEPAATDGDIERVKMMLK